MVTATTTAPTKTPHRGSDVDVVLSACGITKSFDGNAVLRGVDITLGRGQCVLLTGENGSGKTSLINILTGNLQPDQGEITYSIGDEPTTFTFPRGWWQELNPWNHFRPEFVARAGVGRSWQDVRLFGSLSLRDNLAIATPDQRSESPLRSLFGSHAKSEHTSTVLDELGLVDRDDSSADKISLGQSKRVAIARAIQAGAKVLFLDEPLAGLDQQGIQDVLVYLRRLIQQHRVTLVIVEHLFNQHHLLPIVTHRWSLADGICDIAECDEQTRRSSQPISSTREAWIEALIGEGDEVVEETLVRSATLTRIRTADSTFDAPRPALQITDLVVNVGARQVIGVGEDGSTSPLSLTLMPGEIGILQAPNGWGKTTLLNAIIGAIPIEQGSITIDGQQTIATESEDARASSVSCITASSALFPDLTLKETASLAGVALPEMFRGREKRKCSTLSGGERQRLALALSKSNSLNIYDEPLNGLDDGKSFIETCKQMTSQGNAVLILVPQKPI
ncbi:ATP-binding cassette domain-containing protein [Aporhodopirellula aestuarii]|uniref:ATP-binding cassette domain-containing protein n=1 Tax=Aporhodopirellula aestuarii TaxID=2950107 RepID=A0ABT0UCC8_9BACT|nr:ATP-binding cassette domain-containing protein [Aporhodopirellula aestuarii]MCM2374652.1 ATP-binding cassette domain-containing protein [Aporhodopirellula aestuarii]